MPVGCRPQYDAHVTPWVITRAADEAASQCEALREAGMAAVALPCVERVLRPVHAWRPDGYRVVLLTSAAAVHAVRSTLSGFPGVLAALAPHTSAVLRASGLSATIEASGGAVALAHAVAAHVKQLAVRAPVFWYPSSDAGQRAEEQTAAVALLEALGPVTRQVVYETRAPRGLAEAVGQLPERFQLFFASPSAVEHFFAVRPRSAPERVACWGHSTWLAARVHCPTAFEVDRARPLTESLSKQEQHHV